MTRSHRLRIPEGELGWRFSRSSGPGGQHVNTADTRVELLWSPAESQVLTAEQKELVVRRLRGRLVDGVLVLSSSQFRSQHRNREAARTRLEELVAAALAPVKKRRPTRPTKGSKERRLAAKKRRSDTKQGRRGGWD